MLFLLKVNRIQQVGPCLFVIDTIAALWVSGTAVGFVLIGACLFFLVSLFIA